MPRFDIVVYDRNRQPLAVVEIKSVKLDGIGKDSIYYYERDREWASRFGAKYYILITPEKAEFWKVDNREKRKKPDLSLDNFSKELKRFRVDDRKREITHHDYLQSLAWRWLLDIAKGKAHNSSVKKRLIEIGFYQDALDGDAELEIAA